MLSPQQIVSEVLPAMQAALGAGNVMAEARASAPNNDHFDRSATVSAAPLVEAQSPEMDAASGYNFNSQAPGL